MSEPDSVIGYGEGVNPVEKRLAFRVLVGHTECLGEELTNHRPMRVLVEIFAIQHGGKV